MRGVDVGKGGVGRGLAAGSARASLAAIILGTFGVSAVLAQAPLTIDEAMMRARTATAEARALQAGANEAAERVRQARAGYFPRVDLVEDVQRGNQPVFVFSSLLSQRRFTAANFAIDALNHPPAITNVRTGVTVDQPVFDAGLTRLNVQQATIAREIVEANRTASSHDLAVAAAQAFVRVLQLEAAERASRSAVEAAESDLTRARNRRDAGLVTEADVLAVEVHLADMRQRDITTRAELAVAMIELRNAIGAPHDEVLTLARPPVRAPTAESDALVSDALAARPERVEATLRSRLAENARRTAQAAFLPRVGVHGGWEMNGDTFTDQRSSWTVGAQVQINLFRGLGDLARVAEARHAQVRADAERESAERRIELEVRAALARLEGARARDATGRAALAQARESHRIIRDRYDTGLATITDVLRAAEATLDAESRATAAEMDVILARVALDRAVGRM